jgi:hypothetical protein
MINLLITFQKLFFLNKADKAFINFSKRNFGNYAVKNKNSEKVLIDQMFMDGYIFSRAFITNYFHNRFGYEINHYHFIHRKRRLLRFFFSLFRAFSRSERLYCSFNSRFSLGQKYYKDSKSIAKTLKFSSKKDLLDFKFRDIRLGDLIYDTYLRNFSSPTVDLSDPRLKEIIIDALDIYFSVSDYFKKNKVGAVVLSHAVYISYGIVARIALENNINVYNFPWEFVTHKLTKEHPTPHLNHHEHRKIFATLKNKESLLDHAKVILEERLAGRIDQGIAYMRQSAYALSDGSKKVFLNNGKPKVALLLHCFYDAPHIYKNMIFEDFYEWVTFIFERVPSMDIDFVVKPHPNAKPLNAQIIKDLKSKFPYVRILDENITSIDIIKDGLEFMLTVYGTAAAEFAYQGITVLTAGDNPTSPYDFCISSKNKDEFERSLLNLRNLNHKINKREILEFFYMHYLHIGRGRIEGSNDLFRMRKRDYVNDRNIFQSLVNDANDGMFDDVFTKFDQSISHYS